MFISGKGASGRSFSAKHVCICPCGHVLARRKELMCLFFFVVLLECYKAPEEGGLAACSLLLLRRPKTKRVRGKLPWPS